MRKFSLFALLLCLAACGAPARWEKPGADDAMLRQDMADCQRAAQAEAARYYYGYVGPIWGPRSWIIWEQRAESERFYAETNLTRFCMRNKGYELVPIAPPAKATDK